MAWNVRRLWLGLLTLPLVGIAAEATIQAQDPYEYELGYYEWHARNPIGDRQRVRFGKLWPTKTRPGGDAPPLIHRFHHNLYWPQAYICADRQSVQHFSNIQIANGWQDQTTLYDYHFDPATHELNRAGRDHLYWMLSSVPYEHRTAFVQTSRQDPEISNIRLANVQTEASRFVGVDQVPPVLLRVTTPHGTPAADVMRVFDYRRNNLTPPPMVNYEAGGGGGAAGGGGGGGGQ